MIRAGSSNPVLQRLLQHNPKMDATRTTSFEGIEFVTNRSRFVSFNSDGTEVGGVIELMDNNPLVCATRAWVPNAAGCLATLALGPILEAGLVIEPPAVLTSFLAEEEPVLAALATTGYTGGITFSCEDHDLGTVRGVYCIAKISNPQSFDELDDIYEERYGRSFFVRREEEKEWSRELVESKPWACYRLELTEGEEHSLLAIHLMADVHGKAGEGHLIHAMNVMAGFEESVGLV